MLDRKVYGVYTDGKTPDHQFVSEKFTEESLKKNLHIKELFVGTRNECVLFRENEYNKYNLTKAKEIIKTLADDLSMYSGNYQKELLEADQFLIEVEK